MLVFYKEKKYLIISIIVIILDGLIIYYLPSYFNNLSLFYPMLTISIIPFLYINSVKSYYHISLILGFIYDLLYSNVFLFNTFIFLLLSKIDYKILKLFKNNILLYLILVIINIIIYDSIGFLLVIITNYQSISFYDLFYKIEHSLILNIIISILYYFIFQYHVKKVSNLKKI